MHIIAASRVVIRLSSCEPFGVLHWDYDLQVTFCTHMCMHARCQKTHDRPRLASFRSRRGKSGCRLFALPLPWGEEFRGSRMSLALVGGVEHVETYRFDHFETMRRGPRRSLPQYETACFDWCDVFVLTAMLRHWTQRSNKNRLLCFMLLRIIPLVFMHDIIGNGLLYETIKQ